MLPSDSSTEMKTKSTTSSRSRSSASSRGSEDESVGSVSDGSIAPKKSKSKAKAKSSGRPSLKKAPGGSSGVGTFLTAAEQRLQASKAEKKEKEDPYAFLAEGALKDVDLFASPRLPVANDTPT
jgi:DNA mismatch repair protein MSH6